MLAQRILVVRYRVFGTTCWSFFEDCPETSASVYQSTLRNVPKDRRCHLHSGSSLKLHVIFTYMVFDFSGISFRQSVFGTFRIF
jgi:hypothetical protein